MRAKEFLSERNAAKPIRKAVELAGPYAKRYDQIGTYYDMYRLGVAIAGGKHTPAEGPARDNPTVWVNNPVEEQQLKDAETALGIKGTVVVPKGPSEELPSTEVVSPVAKIKRNKYGV